MAGKKKNTSAEAVSPAAEIIHPAEDPKLRLLGVSYVYSKGTPFEMKALDNVSLDIHAGKLTGIIGHTGSGKSTMVQLFNGLTTPTSGKVLLDGEDIWAKPKEIGKIRFRVGLVMQYPEYQLFEETVAADIAFGPKNMGLSADEIKERVAEAADFVSLSHELMEQSPFDLSGGQKRRVAIAGIMAMRPEVLVLDEPAAGLDPQGRRAIFSGIKAYNRQTGCTVIIVSHSMEDMAEFCDDVVVMAHAKVLMAGSRDEIFAHADKLEAVGLDIPQITRLSLMLADAGITFPESLYTVGYAVTAFKDAFGLEKGGDA